jgi:hypothetical protein
MQAKEAVEIDCAVAGRGYGRARDCDGGTKVIITLFAMGHHDVQAVRCAALKMATSTFPALQP